MPNWAWVVESRRWLHRSRGRSRIPIVGPHLERMASREPISARRTRSRLLRPAALTRGWSQGVENPPIQDRFTAEWRRGHTALGGQGARRICSFQRFAPSGGYRRHVGQSRLRAQGPHTCSGLLALGRSETMETSEFVAVPLDERKAVREATRRSGGGLSTQTPLLGRVRWTLTSKNDPSHAAHGPPNWGSRGRRFKSCRPDSGIPRCRSSGAIFGWPLLCVRARIGSPRPLPVLPSLPSDADGVNRWLTAGRPIRLRSGCSHRRGLVLPAFSGQGGELLPSAQVGSWEASSLPSSKCPLGCEGSRTRWTTHRGLERSRWCLCRSEGWCRGCAPSYVSP